MSDPELFRRYADLLEGDAAELAPLAGQLDTLYTALDPPAHLELAIERAVRARPAQAAAATGTEDARPGNRDTRVHAQTERRTFVKSRHLQTFAACAAAFVVVALMAALLHGFGVGVGRLAGPGPRLDDAQLQQNFGRIGGVYAVVQARCPADAPDCDLAKGIQETITVLFGRLSATFNVAEMVIRQNGPDSILIELPGVKSTAQLAPLLNRGALSFLDTGATFVPVGSLVGVCTTSCQPGEYKAVFTGADLDPNSVTAALDPNSGQPVVIFTFEGTARAHFADYTRTHIGQYLTIALDNRIIESATIQSEINGEGQIVGLGCPVPATWRPAVRADRTGAARRRAGHAARQWRLLRAGHSLADPDTGAWRSANSYIDYPANAHRDSRAEQRHPADPGRRVWRRRLLHANSPACEHPNARRHPDTPANADGDG